MKMVMIGCIGLISSRAPTVLRQGSHEIRRWLTQTRAATASPARDKLSGLNTPEMGDG